jgi:hypothetical protein
MKYLPQECKDATSILWSDALHKLDTDVAAGRYTTILPASPIEGQDEKISVSKCLPTIISEGRYCPPSFRPVLRHMNHTHSMGVFHTYISLARNSVTFGRHNDTVDVIIVQAIGKVTYNFDDGVSCTLVPGDALYIPKGEYHAPETHGPRVTLSFSHL